MREALVMLLIKPFTYVHTDNPPPRGYYYYTSKYTCVVRTSAVDQLRQTQL